MGTISERVTFIGGGAMAEAILRGLLEKGVAGAEQICVINRCNTERLKELKNRYQVRTAEREDEKNSAVREADIVILAVKPKDVAETIERYREALHEKQLLVSVIAGLRMDTLRRLVQKTIPLARTMPNTSSTIGLGATGISFTDDFTPRQRETVLEIFRSIGTVSMVEEDLLDIVTGVSGSGPAYVYYLMEAMMAAGIQGGLTSETARNLTVQTVLGAANMVMLTGEEPSELRRKVTSPGGTTQAALETLDRFRFYEAVKSAVLSAAKRAGEMGDTIGKSVQ